MNIESYIKDQAMNLKDSRRSVEIAPEISEEHLKSVIKKYKGVLPDRFDKFVLVMSYTGTGIFFMTGDTFYFDNFWQGGIKAICFSDINFVRVEEGKLFSPDKVFLKTKNNEYTLDACIDGLNIFVLKRIFENIIKKAKEGESFSVSEQGLLSFQLLEDIKLLYLEVLYNYAFINDTVIDPDEYNAITKFSIRMELHGNVRGKLRQYMNSYDTRVKTGTLLAGIKKRVENRTGEWDAVKYCLMQDALYIHGIQSPGKSWSEDGFIGSLMQNLSLRPEQVDSMVKAVSLNKQMIEKDAEMGTLKTEWSDFTRKIKDTSGYVPTPYLFCSGSVYGLKSYSGFLKKDETSQRAINKQRELILQEIIINNQKAVNVLIGDMNYIAEKLETALSKEKEIEADYEKIKLLLSRIKAAMRNVKQEEEYTKLNDDRVAEAEVYNG